MNGCPNSRFNGRRTETQNCREKTIIDWDQTGGKKGEKGRKKKKKKFVPSELPKSTPLSNLGCFVELHKAL